MQSLWLSLAEKSILTDANIRSMKMYIAHKFPTYSSLRRAQILANTVHRHINECLPQLDEVAKERLRIHLVGTAYSQDEFRIAALDVFKACVELSLGNREILDPLEQWLQTQGDNLTEEQMEPFSRMIQNASESFYSGDSLAQGKLYSEVTVRSYEPNGYGWFPAIHIKQYVCIIFLVLCLSFIFNTQAILSYETALKASYQVQIQANGGTEEPLMDYMARLPYLNPDFHALVIMDSIPQTNELTSQYSYTPINEGALRQWLIKRDSLLAEEPYLSTILATSLKYNIHPFLMFAITGQEQSLVPNTNKKAGEIANNPFNVHYSWKAYNTNIEDSSRIAAETILKLIKGRPANVSPLQWINRKYAEDPNWHAGVEAFFNQMLLIM